MQFPIPLRNGGDVHVATVVNELTDRLLETQSDARPHVPQARGTKIARFECRGHARGDALRRIGQRAVEVEDDQVEVCHASVRDRQAGPAVLTGGAPLSVGVDSVGAVLVTADRAAKHVNALSLGSTDVGLPHDLLSFGIAVADARGVLPRVGCEVITANFFRALAS